MKLTRVELAVNEMRDLLDFECPICGGKLKGHHTQYGTGDFEGYQRCPACEIEFAWLYYGGSEMTCYCREA